MRRASRCFGLALLLALSASELAAQEWKNSILPVLGSAPETGVQYGIALMRTRQAMDSLGTRPSTVIGNVVRTSKAQTRVFLDTDWWTPANNWRLGTNSIWQEFPIAFYGVGDDTPETDRQDYTPRTLELAVTVQRRIAKATWWMASLRRIETALVTWEQTPPDAPMPDLGFVDAIPNIPGRHMVTTIGVVGDTRDNLFAPTRGHYREFTTGVSTSFLGSEFEYTRFRVDARRYRPLRRGVLATQFVMQVVDGKAPIDQLAIVGNNTTMRGYAMGRFRDRRAFTAQAEYRSAFRGRLGAAVFGGATMIAPNLSELGDSRLLPSIGGGVRFRLDPVTRSAVRIDYAFGASGQRGLYVAFNEAF